MSDFAYPLAEVGAGMTKREVFAKDAPSVPQWFMDKWNNGRFDRMVVETEEVYFAWRLYFADTLLKHLEQ
jgi:hypothetical protein